MVEQSTIEDVARAAGVSAATVSRALRGLERVHPATRERVLSAAADLDYIASPTAASLASGRTGVVGVVTPFMSRWFFAKAISAIEKTMRVHGHHVLLMDLEDESYERRLPLSRAMLFKRVDAVVVVNVALSDIERCLVEGLRLPVVTVGNAIADWPWVGIDDVGCGAAATEHVISLGHRAVAFIGAVPAGSPHGRTPVRRVEGFRQAMARHRLPVPPGWVVPADWTADGAQRSARSLFTAGPVPTAVVAGSDEMALGVIAAAGEQGLRVPHDLAVIGIDDHELAAVLGLTTVRQDVMAQGAAAAAIILGRLGYLDEQPEDTVAFPVELVVRRTTAAPADPR